jgi:hypothetical protein
MSWNAKETHQRAYYVFYCFYFNIGNFGFGRRCCSTLLFDFSAIRFFYFGCLSRVFLVFSLLDYLGRFFVSDFKFCTGLALQSFACIRGFAILLQKLHPAVLFGSSGSSDSSDNESY